MSLVHRLPLGVLVVSACFISAWAGCTGNVAPINVSAPDGSATEQSDDPTDPADPTAPNKPSPADAGPTSDAATPSDSSAKQPPGDGSPVPIQFGNCPAFSACGGDPVGNWVVSGGCVGTEALEAGKKKCPGLTLSNVVIKAGGKVNVTASSFDRTTTTTFSADVTIPKSCGAFGVFLPCGTVESELKAGKIGGLPPLDSVSCNTVASACECAVATEIKSNAQGPYSTQGGTLTTSNPKGTLDYCVAGDSAQLRETSTTSAASFPIMLQLAK